MCRCRNFWVALAINIFFIVISLSFHHLRYGGIDDYFMAGILSGIYGDEYNVHMPFVNAIYGYALLPLYHMFPKISWYYIGELASVFLSLTLIVYLFVCRMGIQWGSVLGTLLVALYAKDLYVVIQFTLCAEVLVAAGMLSFIYGFDVFPQKSFRVIGFIVVSILFLWWGSIMRWDAYLMGIPVFALTLVLYERKKLIEKPIILIVLLIVFGGAFCFQQFNNSLYDKPGYKEYMEFQPTRVLLGDGTFYDVQAVYEDLAEMERNSRDFDLLKKWYFYDNEVFSPESLEVIKQLINKYTIRPAYEMYPMLLLNELQHIAYTPIFWSWMTFCIVLLLFNKPRSHFLWISLVLMLLMTAYLFYVDRVMYRVEVGFFFYATVMTSVFFGRLPALSNKSTLSLVMLVCVCSLVRYYDSREVFLSPNDGRNMKVEAFVGAKGYRSLSSFIDSQPDSVIFLVPMDTYMAMTEYRLPPYLNEPMGSWQKIIPTGFWTPYYPDVEKSFRSRGMNNPMKDVVNDNVFFVSDVKFGTSLVDYLQTHYYDSVYVDTVAVFSELSVLKYKLIEE